jgi:hypothetical protein
MELKEICGYLPYKLKLIWDDGDIRTINPELDEIDYDQNEIPLPLVLFSIKLNSPGLKLILRPLSDLTKPCLPDGEIPIVELAKIEDLLPSERIRIDENGDIICRLFLNKDNKRILTPVHFMYDLKEGVFKITCDTWHQMSVLTQKQMQEKLYEWHFDIHGLIEKGEAIDINTL